MAEAKKPAKSVKSKAESTKKSKEVKEAELVTETVPVEVTPEAIVEVEEKPVNATAKAGKRSSKAVKEAEEKEAKEERKAQAIEKSGEVAKAEVKTARSKLERAGKKYREVAKLIEAEKLYSLNDALDLATKTSTAKFDATVELHVNLGVDPRIADQNVRDTVALPAGTGKTIRIAVLAEADDAKKAEAAGADIAGLDNLLALLDKEDINFDVLISTPALMARLGKYARMLGPRGLMPNPKSGTVTTDVANAVKDAKAGKVEYRVDQAGIIHLGIGKVSFGAEKLGQNAGAVVASIKSNKPASLKGNYIKSVHVTTSMGPSIKVNPSL
jgi:large subunit ribosomal protein L1